MRTVMQHFDRVPGPGNLPRSVFDRSHGWKRPINAGYLYPFFWDEIIPGDTMRLRSTALIRLYGALDYPIMDNLYAETMFFFVPYWQIWTNAQRFFGERYPDPDTTIDLVTPKVTYPASGFATESLYNCFGIRMLVNEVNTVDYITNLYARAYNWCWNWWVRDQNLQDSATVDFDDGPDDPANYILRRRGKRFDYFTGCLPWPQKGDAVEISLGTSAPVELVPHTTSTNPIIVISANDGSLLPNQNLLTEAVNSRLEGSAAGENAVFNFNGRYVANLASATAATVSQLRDNIALQQFLEIDARSGTRYPEIVFAHFGVRTPDMRVGRPQYLGGGSSRINVHQVAQTSETGTTAQGTLAAFAVGGFDGHGFTQSFDQHGIVIGLLNIRADLTYQQGLPREFTRDTRYDYYWPTFAHLGEQPVYNSEIFFQAATADRAVFGYQERYAEYRYKPSYVTGQFSSDAASSLDFVHLAQDFSALPVLGDTFIQDDPPISRVVASGASPLFFVDAFHEYRCVREIPMFGIPGLARI